MAGIKDFAFHASPLWAKGLLLGAYSSWHGRTKYGSEYRKEVTALRRRATLPSDAIEQEQRDLLIDFLLDIRRHNAFHREQMSSKGVHEAEIRSEPMAALKKLDIMEKPFLKENIESLASGGLKVFAVSNTSGTSGSPMVVPYDKAGYQKGFAYWRRFYDTMGLGESFRNARFSGRVLLGRGNPRGTFWVSDWAERRLFMSTYHMTEQNLPAYVDKLNAYRPQLIDGYPSALAILARFIESSGRKLTFRPKAAAVTAETLFDDDRAVIQRAFGCKVYNQYASSEGSPFITECGHGRLHLNIDTGVFEFIEMPGNKEVKELVVTSFRNVMLPLVRYRIGDTVRIDPSNGKQCDCGSAFPTVTAIEGRADDLLYSSERGLIGRLDPIYKGVSGIGRSQIIQDAADSFVILVEAENGYGLADAELLEQNFRNRVGHSVKLEIRRVKEIPLSANGKFRAVINRAGVRARKTAGSTCVEGG